MQANYVDHYDSLKAAFSLLKSIEGEFEYSMENIKAIAVIFEQLNITNVQLAAIKKVSLADLF